MPKRRIAHKASWGLGILAGLLTGAEAVINALGADSLPVAGVWRAGLILLVTGGAFAARYFAGRAQEGDE